MKTLEDLQKFYQTDLLPDLEVLEQERKAVVKKVLSVSLGVGAVALVVLLLAAQSIMQTPVVFIFILLMGTIAVIGFITNSMIKEYAGGFKSAIIRKLVTFIDPSLEYYPYDCIPEGVFRSSQLYKHSIDRYRGDDLVRGTVDKTAIEFSELHAEYKTTTRDSKGRTQTHWHTIFRGLFFVGDFNKDFYGQTVVLPDWGEAFWGKLAQTFQSWDKSRGELVKLEDREFENLFKVYGTDQIEARYILSTSLMRRIVDFKNGTGKDICLSFIGSKVFMAITFKRALFEPRLFRTILDFTPIQEYYEDLQLAVGIVEDLNLNTRIWTKR